MVPTWGAALLYLWPRITGAGRLGRLVHLRRPTIEGQNDMLEGGKLLL